MSRNDAPLRSTIAAATTSASDSPRLIPVVPRHDKGTVKEKSITVRPRPFTGVGTIPPQIPAPVNTKSSTAPSSAVPRIQPHTSKSLVSVLISTTNERAGIITQRSRGWHHSLRIVQRKLIDISQRHSARNLIRRSMNSQSINTDGEDWNVKPVLKQGVKPSVSIDSSSTSVTGHRGNLPTQSIK
jgi:hypothetical protein